jgi:hypothetical protein
MSGFDYRLYAQLQKDPSRYDLVLKMDDQLETAIDIAARDGNLIDLEMLRSHRRPLNIARMEYQKLLDAGVDQEAVLDGAVRAYQTSKGGDPLVPSGMVVMELAKHFRASGRRLSQTDLRMERDAFMRVRNANV